MSEVNFFQKQTISSKIKASIVSEYFPSYCKIIVSKHKPSEIRFIDLFAGPGIYEDKNISTPILVARHCKENEFLRNNVRLIFNDNQYIEELKSNFFYEFSEETFTKKPRFGNKTVGIDDAIKKFLLQSTHNKADKNDKPALLFIDPFGYKGIETTVLAAFLKNWGNEIFLFINIKRIHAAIENRKFEELMRDLFPSTFDDVKKDRRYTLNTPERLKLIIDSIGKEYETILKEKIFYTAFKFQEEDSAATSHYILHLTKGPRGFDLVKSIYNDFANVGTVFDGKNTYTFDAKKLESTSIGLFDMGALNIGHLKDQILNTFRGMTLNANELFEKHHINTLYSRRHYTDALRELVADGRLTSNFIDNVSHKVPVLISKSCILKFN